jgi:hypothetical protein
VPALVRLAAEVGSAQRRPADHFVSLDSEVNFGAALITGDNGCLDAQRVFEQPGKIMSRGAGAGAAAFGRLLGVAQIVDRFKRRVGAYEVDDVIFSPVSRSR